MSDVRCQMSEGRRKENSRDQTWSRFWGRGVPLDEMRNAVAWANGKAKTEASGGVNLQTVRGIAETGVDYISVGALTHSARAVDIALDF